MYKNNIPLVSQEDIGWEIGLTVPKDEIHLFNKVRTGKKPKAGWGTQINNPNYSLNAAFNRLNIPFKVDLCLISSIDSVKELQNLLQKVEKINGDACLCFNYGKLWEKDTDSGHVCVFDGLENNEVWMVDPEQKVPKHRKADIKSLYKSMVAHGDNKSGGVWIFSSSAS